MAIANWMYTRDVGVFSSVQKQSDGDGERKEQSIIINLEGKEGKKIALISLFASLSKSQLRVRTLFSFAFFYFFLFRWDIKRNEKLKDEENMQLSNFRFIFLHRRKRRSDLMKGNFSVCLFFWLFRLFSEMKMGKNTQKNFVERKEKCLIGISYFFFTSLHFSPRKNKTCNIFYRCNVVNIFIFK